MEFLTESEPERGVAIEVAPGVRRIVAANPSPMTYHGTNTYLLDGEDGVCVVDPGPDDAAHLRAVLKASGKVAQILISHGHSDHTAGLAAMRQATGAAVFAYDAGFEPEVQLADGDAVAGFTALHTPGHAPDHLCLARADGVVLSADHVMGWSTSVVSPPDGSMTAYFASLRRLLARADRLYLPGHGPAITQPLAYVQALLDHRISREAAIVAALSGKTATVDDLVDALYQGLAPRLRPMAGRSVLAHLFKLQDEARIGRDGDAWFISNGASSPHHND